MASRVEELLQEALSLPVEQRAGVAAELLASLDGDAREHPEEVQSAWAAEIERRAQRVMSGASAGIPWSEVRSAAQARIDRQ